MFDLICAGEAFDDFVFYDLAALPAPGTELKTESFVRTTGGGAVITSIAAARLGARVCALTAVSREGAARLRRGRVALTNLRRPNELPAVTVALSTRRDRRFVTFSGTNVRLPQRIIAALPRLRARHLHFALHPGRCRLWLRPLERIRAGGATISWDFGWNPDLARDRDLARLVDKMDLLFMNKLEAELYRPRPRHGLTIVKLGAAGCRATGPDVDIRVRAPRVRVVDTTGAGDVFNGAFLAGRLRGATLADALRRANEAAARSTRHAGGLP